jgi:hypothetical protein
MLTQMPLQELTEQLLAQGVDQKQAERVAEAAIRRRQAHEGHRVFYYGDAEYELDELYRTHGASPELIEDAKEKVWKAARETAAESGCSLEEALFFCFHEAADVYREFLAIRSVIASEQSVDVGPGDTN